MAGQAANYLARYASHVYMLVRNGSLKEDMARYPGVFSVGDARYRSVKRVAAAAGEGSVVISSVRRFLAEQSGI